MPPRSPRLRCRPAKSGKPARPKYVARPGLMRCAVECYDKHGIYRGTTTAYLPLLDIDDAGSMRVEVTWTGTLELKP